MSWSFIAAKTFLYILTYLTHRKNILKFCFALLFLSSLLLSAGCAKNIPAACDALDPEFYVETEDPFESYNRAMFDFNLEFDRTFVSPTARAYRENVNENVQHSVSNFFNNLKEPRNFFAAAMMGNVESAANAAVRFTFNSTLGLAGFIDIGEAAGMPYADYEFGHALGYWGIGSGPYIVLPVVGPATPRSLVGSAVHSQHTYVVRYIKKSEEQLFVQNMQWLDARVRLFPFTDLLEKQPDPYIFARESYQQTRLNKICSS